MFGLLTRSNVKRGFTLLEIFLAIVLSLAAFWCMDAYGRGLLALKESESLNIAMNLAQEQIEEIRRQPYAAINSLPRQAVPGFSIAGQCPRRCFERQVNVTPQAPNNPKRADVIVYWWLPRGGQESITLSTYVADFE